MNYMDNRMPIGKKNLKLMIIGLLVLILGFILLSGGRVTDPNVFNYDMFDFRRLVLSPVVMVAGIVIIIVSIIKKPVDR